MSDLPLIGIGASAGGVEALLTLVAGLDARLSAAVLVALHQPADGPSVLAGLLDRRCPLAVAPARDGDRPAPGSVLVAPPGADLWVEQGRVATGAAVADGRARPGVDTLFRSLARAAGRRATGVVLSGLLDDGAAGLLAIVEAGGSAVVQDPDEALHGGMPRAALGRVPGAHVCGAADVGAVLTRLAGGHDQGGHAGGSAGDGKGER